MKSIEGFKMKARLTFILIWIATAMVQANTGSETFQIVGSQIIGPDGKQFIPKGVNVSGMKWGWPGNPVNHVSRIVDDWDFNMVRVNCRLYDYYWNGQNVSANSPFQTILDMQPIVEAFTSRKVVVMFEFHDQTGSYYKDDKLFDLMDAWRDVINLYGDNPYVWYNIMNEPGTNDSREQIDLWVSMHQQVIEVIRDEQANNNVIVVDAHFWGQDAGTRSSEPVLESNSSILSAGNRLINFNGKTYPNIMFSFHVYDQWNVGQLSQLKNRMHDYIERIHAKGLAVMIGEYGTKPTEGNLYYPNAFQATMDVAPAHGVGLIWWHWYGGDNIKLTTSGNGGGTHINNSSNPTNLTSGGQQVWDYNHFSGNRKPFITLHYPNATQVFSQGNDVLVKAAAADVEDGIKEVRFYVNGKQVETKAEAPYDFTIASAAPGRYLLSSRAEDNAGNESDSETVAIDVKSNPSKGSVLFVTGDGELSASDQQLYNQILKEGFDVYHKRQGEVAGLHANRRIAIVLSGTVTDVAVGSLFVESSIPLIAGNSDLFSVLKLTGPAAGADYGTIVGSMAQVVNSSVSPVLDGFNGEVSVYNQTSVISFGVPGSEAEILITAKGDNEKAVLFLYSEGSNMYNYMAPSVRAGWFGKPDSGAHFTENSLILFGRVLNNIISEVTSINGVVNAKGFSLLQNYPNPFMNSTTIEYVIEQASIVHLEVINPNGMVQDVLVRQFLFPGKYSVKYRPEKNISGPLLYRMRINSEIITRTMIAY